MSNGRKTTIFTILGAIIALIGFIAGRISSPITPTSLAKPDPVLQSEIPLRRTPQDPTPTNNQLLVKRVIDGDTIELDNGDKVRYIGIDTPETLDPRKPVQCFGKNASAKNKELVEGKPVWLVKDITDKDKYGRLLRYVYLGDPDQESSVFVNLELVKQGFAHSSTYPPDIKFQELFLAAQAEARDANRGLWNSCPIVTPSISSSPSSPSVSASDCLIKANIGSTGDKIYHLPGCGSYDKTAIDESRGEKWFCSEDEAVSAGWRKAKNC